MAFYKNIPQPARASSRLLRTFNPSRSFLPTRSILLIPSIASNVTFQRHSMAKVSEPNHPKMPPFHKATTGHLRTFVLPDTVNANDESMNMAKAMIKEWRETGIFQIQMTSNQQAMLSECFETSKKFFRRSHEEKAKHVDDQSFAGYIASGEEITDGIADYSEIFTVTKDLPASDVRVQEKWPCHGPTPWPSELYKDQMNQLMKLLGDSGEKLLKLVGMGLGLKDPDALLNLTEDGWHHSKCFPALQDRSY